MRILKGLAKILKALIKTPLGCLGAFVLIAAALGHLVGLFTDEETKRRWEAERQQREEYEQIEERMAAEVKKVEEERMSAMEDWVNNNGLGSTQTISPAPDWARGQRFNVRTTSGEELLFYFGAGSRLCGVWRVRPRTQIFHDPEC